MLFANDARRGVDHWTVSEAAGASHSLGAERLTHVNRRAGPPSTLAQREVRRCWTAQVWRGDGEGTWQDVTCTYDAAHGLTQVTDSASNKTAYTLDAAGDHLTATEPL